MNSLLGILLLWYLYGIGRKSSVSDRITNCRFHRLQFCCIVYRYLLYITLVQFSKSMPGSICSPECYYTVEFMLLLVTILRAFVLKRPLLTPSLPLNASVTKNYHKNIMLMFNIHTHFRKDSCRDIFSSLFIVQTNFQIYYVLTL